VERPRTSHYLNGGRVWSFGLVIQPWTEKQEHQKHIFLSGKKALSNLRAPLDIIQLAVFVEDNIILGIFPGCYLFFFCGIRAKKLHNLSSWD
jgi:hypothetical protein